MSHIKIRGGHSLHGEIEVQGAKNAALPIIAASVLNNGMVRLRRCPQIMDVHHMLRILQQSGARIMWDDGDVWVKTDQMDTVAVSSLDAGKMRSSIILLGALLGRGQEVTMPYPGGCTIGARPIDWHIDALRKMNVQINLKENKIECKTTGLKGNRIELPYPSVGVTENILLAAVLADGVTEIIHAAMEPEIADLCRFLKKSGACIEGEGTERIRIKGVKTLHDTEYTIMADRIAAGTYMAAAAAVGGEIVLKGIHIENVRAVADVLVESGCGLIIYKESIKIMSVGRVEPEKGFDMAVEACNILKKNNFSIKWYIVGDGTERKKLEEKIDKYGLKDTFYILGFKENPYAYLAQGDIYVQPSRFEGKSIAIDEAKIMNMPIVLTNFNTAKYQIDNNKTGVIVDMNAQSLAYGIEKLITNTKLKENLINNLSIKEFGNEEEIDKLYELI
mgnify:CR=1 FL=1